MLRSTKNPVSRSRQVMPTLEALEDRQLMSTGLNPMAYYLKLDGAPGEASTDNSGGGVKIAEPDAVHGYKWRRPWPWNENPADGHLLMQPTNPIQIKIEEAVQVVSAVAKRLAESPPSLVQGKLIQAEVVAHIFAGGADQAVVKIREGQPIVDPAGPLAMKVLR